MLMRSSSPCRTSGRSWSPDRLTVRRERTRVFSRSRSSQAQSWGSESPPPCNPSGICAARVFVLLPSDDIDQKDNESHHNHQRQQDAGQPAGRRQILHQILNTGKNQRMMSRARRPAEFFPRWQAGPLIVLLLMHLEFRSDKTPEHPVVTDSFVGRILSQSTSSDRENVRP